MGLGAQPQGGCGGAQLVDLADVARFDGEARAHTRVTGDDAEVLASHRQSRAAKAQQGGLSDGAIRTARLSWH